MWNLAAIPSIVQNRMEMFPFIDTHHHMWDLTANYYPWLTDKIVVKPYGDYSSIRKDYLIQDFFRDRGDLPLVKSVHVQASHDPADPVRETRWLQSVADDTARSHSFPQAIIAEVDLSSLGAGAVLEAHCKFENVRGIRAILSDAVRYPGKHPELLDDSLWRNNVSLLEAFGLSFDVQLYPQQMASLAAVTSRHPALPFVICHAGLPEDRSSEGRQKWKAAMRLLAEKPNVLVKMSGFGLIDQQWTVDSMRPIVLEIIDMFGVQRCFFGSNFPVDRLFATYRRFWHSVGQIVAGFDESEQRMMLRENAERVYRI
jgi:predicted TIM-barrel fold metal-dependent hydrolase